MSDFQVEAVDQLIKQMDAYTFDKLAPIMVKEAAPILERKIREKAAPHKVSGNMLLAIKPTGLRRSKGMDGYYITVRPTGRDSKRPKVRNMAKMVYLEYGTRKQNSTPVISVAVTESQASVYAKLQEVYNREMNKT